MLSNSLATGNVWHERKEPKKHRFSYSLNMWLVDVDNLDEFDKSSCLLGYRHHRLYRLRVKDYFRDSIPQLTLGDQVRAEIKSLGAELLGCEKIFLLGQVSNLGVYFSPLNLYLVFVDDVCRYILAEVSNTPWNERHYYLLDKSQPQIITKKNFHVSPFFSLEQEYHWQFNFTKDEISFKISSFENERNVFNAGYSCKLVEISEVKRLSQQLITKPFNVYKILFGIYFEAFRIWRKKIPFVPYNK